MSLTSHTILYDFKDDKRMIEDIQNATLNSKDFGLQIEHGLIGSKEWWEAVEKNKFEKVVIEGVISRVFMSGHNDYAEFEITSGDKKSNWTRKGKDEYYVVGKKARITCVMQKFKKPLEGMGLSNKHVLMIEIEK